MKKLLLLFIILLNYTYEVSAQCTLTGSPNVNSSTVTCSTFSGCTIIYIGNGTNPTNVVMNQNLDFSCYGAIQLVIRNNANIDFSNGNYDLSLAAGSSIVVESGGNISAGSNCSASDLIKIGSIKVASCNGGGGAVTDFPTLVSDGGFNVVIASATAICGSGTSVITASQNPAPTSSTTFKFYTVASGGTPIATSTVTSSPYTVTYTTGTLSANTTYYVEAVTNSSGATTPRKAVLVVVNALPATPSVTPTHPTCSVSTGIITVNSPTGSGMTYSINGSTYSNTTGIFTTVASGTYNVTAKSAAGCISATAASVTINTQPFTPAQPTVDGLSQPTCTLASGSFVITNYNAGYSYAVSPSTGVTISGATVSAPAGTYTVTATLGSCTSIASSNITISQQPTNTWSSSGWSNGTPTAAQKLVFSATYSSTENVSGCTCSVTSGAVTFNAGHTLTIANEVSVNPGGSLTFEDTASLVQINDGSTNSGNIIYKRNTTPMKLYDYGYWSSPVSNATLSQLAGDSYFYSYSPSINNYVYQTAATPMALGVGYLSRTPENLVYNPTLILQSTFIGTPNNGLITTPIIKSIGTNNLIGNPYPSAINIDLFITDAANSGVVNGTIFLWTHNTAITNNNYTANDYAKYNLTGGVATATPAISGGAVPTGKVAAGQAFFIEANTALANGTYSATFKNSMRVSGNNNQFFRTSNPVADNDGGSISQGLEKNRVWVSLSSSEGAYNQMLVGYIENATNDIDPLFDGKTAPVGNTVAIYTTVGATNLSIQGKALPFSVEDAVPFGYSTTINGELTITLENFDGVFDNQDVYLLDKTTGLYHNLKAENFTFTTTSGTFEDRFELRYTTQALGVDTPTFTDNDVKVVSNNNGLSVYCASTNITKVAIFDVLGKLLFNQNAVNATALEAIQLQRAPQMLLVKVTLENGQTYTKKTLIQ